MKSTHMEKLISTFKNNMIHEIFFKDFWYNLYILSQKEEFIDFLYNDFYLDGNSFNFSNEFNMCLDNGDLLRENKNIFYISMSSEKSRSINSEMTIEERKKYLEITREYIDLNIEKSESKIK